ncbi:hypothetical protein [Klebsiella pneumoniae]|uniref:hypothetical protein n=1 Tax=Klebsiella pneumoniae TaxID=573 RepID=UPI001E3A9046|nr:hypothetical protein [Klebsiella pneumoniae]
MMIANNNLIEQGDHVIAFLTDKKFISDVERLFQPSPFFLWRRTGAFYYPLLFKG